MASSPETNGNGERPKKPRGPGRPFAKGNPGGPGRPSRAAELSYLDSIKAGCSKEDVLAITTKAVAQAKRGDRYAREWLSKQLGTEAAQRIEQEIRQTVRQQVAFTDDVRKILADPEATTRLLDAVQGVSLTAEALPALLPPLNGNGHANGNGTNGAGD